MQSMWSNSPETLHNTANNGDLTSVKCDQCNQTVQWHYITQQATMTWRPWNVVSVVKQSRDITWHNNQRRLDVCKMRSVWSNSHVTLHNTANNGDLTSVKCSQRGQTVQWHYITQQATATWCPWNVVNVVKQSRDITWHNKQRRLDVCKMWSMWSNSPVTLHNTTSNGDLTSVKCGQCGQTVKWHYITQQATATWRLSNAVNVVKQSRDIT